MVTCTRCGNALHGAEYFCPHCGADNRETDSGAGSRFYPHDPPTIPIPVQKPPYPPAPARSYRPGPSASSGYSAPLSGRVRAAFAAGYVLLLLVVLGGIGAVTTRNGTRVITADDIGSNEVARPDPPTGYSGPPWPYRGENPTERGPAPCALPPSFDVVGTRLGPAGALRVGLSVDTPCGTRQVLADSDVHIEIVQSGSTSARIAAGEFDFHVTPLLIDPDGSSRLRLIYPTGGYVVPSSANLEVTTSPVTTHSTRFGTGSRFVELRGSDPAGGTDSAEALLRRQVEVDTVDVAPLAGSWVPQLASARPGTRVGGEVFDFADILERHLSIRSRYPRARLLYSGDWSVFSAENYYVTVYARPFATARGALAWCEQTGRGPDKCFAKLLSHTAGVEGSTRYQN